MRLLWRVTRKHGLTQVRRIEVTDEGEHERWKVRWVQEHEWEERRFERAWFEDFRRRWQRDLAAWHWDYLARLEEIDDDDRRDARTD